MLPPPSRSAPLIAAVALCGVILGGIAAWITATSDGHDASDWAAAGRAVMVAVPVLAGCCAWYWRPSDRFGPLLAVTGFVTFLATLSESDDQLLYSAGRISLWFVELLLIYLILSFPSGRLPARRDAALVAAAAVLVAVLYLPTALLVADYPTPAPYTSCDGSDCPPNAFMVAGSEPAFVDDVIQPLRELLLFAVLVAVMVRITTRVRTATPLMRRTLSPVLVVAVGRLFLFVVALATRAVSPGSPAVDGLMWALGLALPVIALAFLFGLLRWRLFLAGSIATLGARLRGVVPASELRHSLANALGDPHLRLAFPAAAGASWIDSEGDPIDLRPAPGGGEVVTEVHDGARTVAAIRHDAALEGQDELMGAAIAYTRVSVANGRLSARLESSLEEVSASRARISAAADEERRRIERDLHDGAQQRLVALRIQLELAGELIANDPDHGTERLHRLGADVEETLEDIRTLASGIFPPILADRGLGEALRVAALHSPINTLVRHDGIARYARGVESAVYFCCLEAMQNAAKHADGAHEITVELSDDGALHFTVSDDGIGFDAESAPAGAGFQHMRDRIGSVGGELTIDSQPGHGTSISGRVPVGAA